MDFSFNLPTKTILFSEYLRFVRRVETLALSCSQRFLSLYYSSVSAVELLPSGSTYRALLKKGSPFIFSDDAQISSIDSFVFALASPTFLVVAGCSFAGAMPRSHIQTERLEACCTIHIDDYEKLIVQLLPRWRMTCPFDATDFEHFCKQLEHGARDEALEAEVRNAWISLNDWV